MFERPYRGFQVESPDVQGGGEGKSTSFFSMVEKSGILEKFHFKYTKEQLARIMLDLSVFAPLREVDTSTRSQRMDVHASPDSLRFLADGRIIEATFDLPAFTYICLDILKPITDDEAKELFEALKDAHIIERVYAVSSPERIDSGLQVTYTDPDSKESMVQPVLRESPRDTGRAGISPKVKRLLLEVSQALEAGEMESTFENYQETMEKARTLLRDNLPLYPDTKVALYLREKETELVRFFQLRSSEENPSGDELDELSAYHTLRASGTYPRTLDSLEHILEEGFFSQPSVHRVQGPNAFLGFASYDPQYEQEALSKGHDVFLLELHAAKSVTDAVLKAHEENVYVLPEPHLLKNEVLILVDNVPPEEIGVTIKVDSEKLASRRTFYQSFFEQFPDVEWEIQGIHWLRR